MRQCLVLLGLFAAMFAAADPQNPIPTAITMPKLPAGYYQPTPLAVDWTPGVQPFGDAPEPGVHPRVLIGPEGLPALRQRLHETACGKRAWGAITSWVQYGTRQDGPLTAAMQALADGNTKAADLITDGWWKAQLCLHLNLSAFRAMVDEDGPALRQLCLALRTYVLSLDMDAARKQPIDPNLGFAYDWLYNTMTEEERADVRSTIATLTAGRSSHGMDMAPERRTYNWMPHGMQLCLLALAIEGEPGYDPTVYARSVPVMRDFLTYGIYPDGAPREGTHYFNYGMGTGGAPALIAMARRGDNLLQHPHLWAVNQWYANVVEPYGFDFAMHGDTPNANGGLLANFVLMKNLWPSDPVVDFIWRNRVGDRYTKITYRGDFLVAALYSRDWQAPAPPDVTPPTADKWGADAGQTLPVDFIAPWTGPDLGLPLSFVSPARGLLITRTGWDPEALDLHVECRRDAVGPGHNHSNQNDFTLSALGRKWVIDRGFHVAETAHHSCVLIDGQGQGFFAAPGRFTTYLDSPLATVVTGDARDAYTYRHTFPWRTGNAENKGSGWRPSPFNENAAAALYNPVEYAYRTLNLVRGQTPYVLILDDVRKDGSPHLYQWLMQVPDDLQMSAVDGQRLTLRDTTDNEQAPSLLVQVIDPPIHSLPGGLDIGCERYQVKRTPETGDTQIFGLGTRVVIAGRTSAMAQITLLLPQAAGAEPPTITTTEEGFTIELPDQQDVFTVTRTPGKATALALDRNHGEALLTVGLRQVQAATGAGFKAQGDLAALAWMEQALYLSGSGWKSLALNGLPVTSVNHDGSAQTAVASDDNHAIITE